MSPSNLIPETGSQVLLPGSSDVTREIDLTPELKEALLTQAKAIITRRVQPDALQPTSEIEQFLQQEFGQAEEPPTAEALRRISERLCLEAHYHGQPVACFTTPAGTLAVLACGDREIKVLLRGLSDEEAAKVVVTDTETFGRSQELLDFPQGE